MSRVQVTFDAVDPHALARWWAEFLGCSVEVNEAMIQGLLDARVVREQDVTRFDGRLHFADAVAVSDPTGTVPRLYFQRVPEGKAGKNRLHLDIAVPAEELEAQVDTVCGSGAVLVEYRSHPGHRWAVMQDPEGNEFCLH